jgi:SAF domain
MVSTVPPRTPLGVDRPGPTLVPGPGRQRRWSLALVAVLVTLGSALGFVILWMNAGGREPVLALANDVQAGEQIQADDLRVVKVSFGTGITPVAASASDQVVGRPAAVDLLAGTLLTADAVGDDGGVDTTAAVISIPVPRNELPSPDLARGDTLSIWRTTQNGGDEDAQPREIGTGRVTSVDIGEDGGSSDVGVSVRVDRDILGEVADAIGDDQVYLAIVPNGG